jgi:hypothetical protein
MWYRIVQSKLARYLLILLFLAVPLCADEWNLDVLPLSQVKAGMTGVGKTVFSGDRIEEFGVEVLDIVRNFYPQMDVILVRLSGPQVEHSGVVAGMSGSPVYINGKLMGALALRFGEFPKDPIGGVMPIEAMLQVANKDRNYELERGSLQFSGQFLHNALCGAGADFWPGMVARWQAQSVIAPNRIESPLVFAGFSESLLSEVTPWVRSLGFQAVSGGSPTGADFKPGARLEPGAAVSQLFVGGDMAIDATGTVTAVQGNRVLAFGHHIFNLGPTRLPMASSRILTTLSSVMASSKMSSSLDIIGTLRQDRMAGVYGELGTPPPLIPVNISTESVTEGRRSFRLLLADDPVLNNLTPLFLRIAAFQCLVTSRLAASPSSVDLDGDVKLSDGTVVTFQDFFSSEQRLGFMGAGSEVADASDLIANVLGVLWVNDLNPPQVKEINVRAKLLAGERYARLRNVWQDRSEVRPGDSLQVHVILANHNGKEMMIRRRYQLPKNLTSRSVMVLIGSGSSLTMLDAQMNPEKYRPKEFADLLRILDHRRRNDRLYIQLRTSATGMIVAGEELSSLPPSVLRVMNHRSGGEDRPIRDQILLEESQPMAMEISGLKRLMFRVIQPDAPVPQMESPAQAETVLEY